MAGLRLNGVRKVYDNGHVAVHGADIEARDGEFVVLVGPSGCGKSTTLRMIAGLESITAGELWIGDRLVNDVPPKDRDIAMVFQNYALYPHMTVFENMAFSLKLRKYPKADMERRVHEAADILGIRSILDRKPKQLSGGQRQRVAVGRAIVRNPQVFLFDEPLSNLDASLRVQMRTEISRLHQQVGATMVYVTHDQVEAMTMGDRIVVMKDGHVQQIDTPLNLYANPVNRFVAGFIGSPAMNFVTGEVVRENGLSFRASGGTFTVPVGYRHESALASHVGRSVILGIRPEAIRIAGGRSDDHPAAPVDMVIDVLEPMGNEVFVYARAGSHSVVARVAPQPLPAAGQPVSLAFDLTRLHFFDGQSEEVIQPVPSQAAA